MPQKNGFFDKLSEFDAFYILQTKKVDTFDGLRLWIDTLVEQFTQHATAGEQTDLSQSILLAMMDATATDEAWRVAFPKYKAVMLEFVKRHTADRPITCIAELFEDGGKFHCLAEAEPE